MVPVLKRTLSLSNGKYEHQKGNHTNNYRVTLLTAMKEGFSKDNYAKNHCGSKEKA
jgi:hypothetical protein